MTLPWIKVTGVQESKLFYKVCNQLDGIRHAAGSCWSNDPHTHCIWFVQYWRERKPCLCDFVKKKFQCWFSSRHLLTDFIQSSYDDTIDRPCWTPYFNTRVDDWCEFKISVVLEIQTLFTHSPPWNPNIVHSFPLEIVYYHNQLVCSIVGAHAWFIFHRRNSRVIILLLWFIKSTFNFSLCLDTWNGLVLNLVLCQTQLHSTIWFQCKLPGPSLKVTGVLEG